MIIEFTVHKIYIKNYKSNLKPRHLSQLSFWGFDKNDSEISLSLDNEIDKVLPKVINYFDNNNLSYTLSDSSIALLDRVNKRKTGFQEIIESGRRFKNGIYDSANFSNHIKFLDEHIPRQLKDHQIKASYHLSLVRNGANFSVPGAGKTTVVLTAFEKLRLKGEVNTLFVIGPPACFGPWKEEYEAVLGRKPDSKILAGGSRSQRKSEYYKRDEVSELYLTTFQTLLNDVDEVNIFLNNRKVNAFLVIDEAHYIKQINGNWAQAVLNITSNSRHRCVLTGTPIPKSYTDLYNLFDFLWPDNNPISDRAKTQLRLLEESEDFETASQILEPIVGPLFYRVRKTELGLQPQIFHDSEAIPMKLYERKVYDAIIKKIRNYATDDYLINIDLVEKLRRGRMMRLRQCLSYTKLLSSAIDDYAEDLIEDDSDLRYVIYNYEEIEMPGKIERLLELIIHFHKKNEKVVIWSHFIGTIKFIENILKKEGFHSKKIIGETPIERTSHTEEETREKIRNDFVKAESGLDILLANPAACAESISLHKTCHNAVYYDLSYNCAQFLQSLDRIHRVGGSEYQEAYYYFLQYQNTIDPDILFNLQKKAQRMYDIIEGDYTIYSLDMFDVHDELEAYQRLFTQ